MQKNFYLPNLYLLVFLVFLPLHTTLARESFAECSQTIDVVINDFTYHYYGRSTTGFVNQSGDTLHQLFYHAYFNAFRKGSALEAGAEEQGAPAIAERIRRLDSHQEGSLDIDSCTVNGQQAATQRTGTIVRIDLPRPLPPGERISVSFSFAGRIPWIVRRAGRNNIDNIRYSMAQWYPKLCQYDEHGWHNNQYLFREFYGVFSSYDVRITLPARYVVGATGTLQNPGEVGHGYQYTRDTIVQPSQQNLSKDSMLTWHFRADNVHDFAWVADENYTHEIAVHGSTVIHVLHDSSVAEAWAPVALWCKRALDACGALLGSYPYASFTCAQAGDGGMEYPQLIMIQHRERNALLHVVVHEIVHQWFYGLVASNETQHAWLDEGFTEYLEHRITTEHFPEEPPRTRPLLQRLLIPERPVAIATELTYFNVVRTGLDEPLSTPHDRFSDYGVSWIVYDKGMAFLRQLEYSFGRKALDSCLQRYARLWRYGHPYPRDFEKICEDVFGQRMDDIFDTFINTTHLPDYEITSMVDTRSSSGMYSTTIELKKNSIAHVPLTLYARLDNDQWITHRIPSDISYNPNDTTTAPWLWPYPSYTAELTTTEKIMEVRLDTTHALLDLIAENNTARSRFFLPYAPPVRIGLWQRYDQAVPLHYYGISVRPSLWRFAPGNWQAGVRTDGLIDFNRHRTTAGVYINSASGKIDWQAAYSHPFGALGPFASYAVRLWSMDGTRHAGLSLATEVRQKYSARERWKLTAAVEYRDATAPGSLPMLHPSLRDVYKAAASARYEWKDGSLLFEAVAAGTDRAGAQATATAHWTSLRTPTHALHFRFFATAATPLLPVAQWYSLHTTTSIDQFDNVPYRFAAGMAPALRSLFLPGGGAFAGETAPMRTILSLHMSLRDWYPLQIGLPVANVVEAGIYGSIALAGSDRGIVQKPFDALHAEAGLLVSLNLNDIAPYAQALWIFSEEPVISLFVPFFRQVPGETSSIGTRGIRVGVGTAL